MTVEERQARREHWVGVIQRHAASGQSGRQFCAQEQMSYWQFLSWRRRLGLAPARRPADVPAAAGGVGGFVELLAGAGRAGAGVRLETTTGVSVVLERGFDAQVLAAVLAVLRERV